MPAVRRAPPDPTLRSRLGRWLPPRPARAARVAPGPPRAAPRCPALRGSRPRPGWDRPCRWVMSGRTGDSSGNEHRAVGCGRCGLCPGGRPSPSVASAVGSPNRGESRAPTRPRARPSMSDDSRAPPRAPRPAPPRAPPTGRRRVGRRPRSRPAPARVPPRAPRTPPTDEPVGHQSSASSRPSYGSRSWTGGLSLRRDARMLRNSTSTENPIAK